MAKDIETLTQWLIGMLVIASICATAFPILYLFAPWYKTRLGRALMIQGWAFALALDVTLLFQFWQPKNIMVLFWVNAFVFTLIAFATGYLTWKMLKHNLYIPLINKKKKEKLDDRTDGELRAEALQPDDALDGGRRHHSDR